jgi:hypothetical protein
MIGQRKIKNVCMMAIKMTSPKKLLAYVNGKKKVPRDVHAFDVGM